MFSRVSKVMNLQLRSMWDRICTTMHMHGKVKSKILVISISIFTTIGSDLIKVGGGGGDTFRHLYTYKDLKLYPYKVQITQKIKDNDPPKRLEFAKWCVDKLHDEEFASSLLMSDEAHFTLDGQVNKQNCRFWAS